MYWGMNLWLRCVLVIFVQAWKKIEETKKKATEIMMVRQRNNDNKAFKEQVRMQKDNEDRERMERNY